MAVEASLYIDPNAIKDPAIRAVYLAQMNLIDRAARDSRFKLITTAIAGIGGIVALLNLSKILGELQKTKRSRRTAAAPLPAATPTP